ncbi:MAG: hypothetical protein MI923_27680 [Phycisphaerales bacterium]|nr:hypothetical protein [Phycisphaerales bacterium]
MGQALFSVAPSSAANKLDVKQVDDSKIGSLPSNLTSLAAFEHGKSTYVLGYEKSTGKATVFEAYDEASGTFMKEIGSDALPSGSAIVEPFHVARQPWFLTYDPASEYGEFVEVGADLSLKPVSYKAPIGTGFSTVHPFAYRYGMYFVAYDIENGHVARYQLSVPAGGPMYAAKTWTDLWAQGWTRFAFFEFGGEIFFIKTNLKHEKVNIDHFMDNANEGSHPVLDIDVPAQMAGLHAVSTFSNARGDPYFVTYRSNGEMTYNRFYGNCLGWTVEANSNSIANASLLCPFTVGAKNFVLLYAGAS